MLLDAEREGGTILLGGLIQAIKEKPFLGNEPIHNIETIDTFKYNIYRNTYQ